MESIGRILGISELNVKILLNKPEAVELKDLVACKINDKEFEFEILEIEQNIAYAIPFERVIGLKKGLEIYKKEGWLQIEY